MGKGKAYFITAVIVIFAAALIWLLWENAIRSYWVVVQIIALYGFIRGSIDLANWVAKPESGAHKRIPGPEQFTKYGWDG